MIQQRKERKVQASKTLVVLASAVVVVAGAKASANFFVPVLLAFFIATVSFPITNWLRNHRVPRSLAVLITVLVDFAFLAGIVLLGVMLVGELQTKWESKYYNLAKERVTQLADSTSDFMSDWGMLSVEEEPVEEESVAEGKILESKSEASELVPDVPDALAVSEPLSDSEIAVSEGVKAVSDVKVVSQAGIDVLSEELLKYLSVNKVVQLGTNFLGTLVSFLGTSFVVMLLIVFMLSEARMFGRRFNSICEARGPNLQRMRSATQDIQRYLGIKTLISLVTGFLAGVLCWAVGLEFPLLWGILAFGLNYIPAVGSVIAGIPPVLLSLLVDGDWKNASIIAGGYLLINGFLGNFLEPNLLGRRFGISTLVVMVSVLFWGWIWGPVGMLLAVPLTMVVKVAMDNSADFRWIAVAISKDSGQPELDNSEELKEAVQQSSEAEQKRQQLAKESDGLTEMFPES